MTETAAQQNTSRASIRAQLDVARKELLDVGMRNPLINYRTHTTGKTGKAKRIPRRIETVGESPVEVYRLLVTEGRGMAFLPAQYVVGTEEEDETPGLLPVQNDLDEALRRQTDLFLQSNLTEQRLDAQLLEVYRMARTSQEEQGVNNLYLALGMLRWYEADASNEARFAPLLLIPVELERTNVQSRFRLKHSGDEVTYNRTLEAKLRGDFGVNLPVPSEGDDLNVGAYFAAVETAIGAQRRWGVEATAVHLSFFSFTKFLMHRDLDPTNWPPDRDPENHPLIRALLGEGFGYEPSELSDDDHLDDRLPVASLNHVLDADSSQTAVIHDVSSGRNLVVEGPPGTGKSQTITNMIAEGIARGKRVLFVAEKMAALEVVKRRLDQVGLGDACLELHSHKSNKKAVLAELKHTLALVQPQQSVAQAKLEELAEMRQRLNDYANAVNAPMATSGINPYQAFGELHALRERYGDANLTLDETVVLGWGPHDLERRQDLISRLVKWLLAHGLPSQHPFWGSRKTTYTPLDEPHIRAALTTALEATKKLRAAGDQLGAMYGLYGPKNRFEAEHLAAVVTRAMQAPPLDGVQLDSDDWVQSSNRLETLFDHGLNLQSLHANFDQRLEQTAWGQDVTAEYEALKAHGQKLLKFLIGPYRKAQDKVRAVYQGKPDRELEKQLEVLQAILKDKELSAAFEEGIAYGAMLFGTQWQGRNSSFPDLRETGRWVRQMRQDVSQGALPRWAPAFLQTAPKLDARMPVAAVRENLTEFSAAIRGVLDSLDLNEQVRFGPDWTLVDQPLAETETVLERWLTQIPRLQEMATYILSSDELNRAGLVQAHEAALRNPSLAEHLTPLLRRSWLQAFLRQAYLERPVLTQFDRATQDDLVGRFRSLDKLSYVHNRERVALIHWRRLPSPQVMGNTGQLAVLKRQFELKTRHMPIRKLMSSAGHLIQSLKPVFMMSPLSIANFLEPGGLEFDLVIFDEASQVKPADALGAIMRAKQVVVVGDSRQLPPTNFFERSISGDDGDSDEEAGATADLPSVLGLFKSKNVADRMLRWHYRSRHESLIAVSNRLFYENKLVIFPSPGSELERTGMVFNHLPSTIYDRGGSRTNVEEARAIARSVIGHAKTEPGVTLGVVAFSTAQQRAIEDQLEMIRREHPECETFFTTDSNEPFFVKNLENVQGDERDVIYVSVGYGRDAEGKLTMNFGPVNSKGGEKRLNVLFTRARMRCEVFSNFAADKLATTAESPAGLRALKTYLHQAQTGRIESIVETSREPDSPFEVSVRDALTARGYAVKAQIGVAGYFIDLAVVNPERPGRYLLGIECDGATYHSARSARDRDRLRQAVLENLGWRIHRIWSTDFFRHPAAEIDRTVEAIERARLTTRVKPVVAEAPTPVKVPEASTPTLPTPVQTATPPAPQRSSQPTIPPYEMVKLSLPFVDELHRVPVPQLAQWIGQVVTVEGPVHVDEAIRRITEAVGVQRVGNRIREAMDESLRYAEQTGMFKKNLEFLWPNDMTRPPVRDRSALSAASRKLEYVSNQELAISVIQVVSGAYGLAQQEIAQAVIRQLGFGRVTEAAQKRVDGIVKALVRANRLNVQAGQVIPNSV